MLDGLAQVYMNAGWFDNDQEMQHAGSSGAQCCCEWRSNGYMHMCCTLDVSVSVKLASTIGYNVFAHVLHRKFEPN